MDKIPESLWRAMDERALAERVRRDAAEARLRALLPSDADYADILDALLEFIVTGGTATQLRAFAELAAHGRLDILESLGARGLEQLIPKTPVSAGTARHVHT